MDSYLKFTCCWVHNMGQKRYVTLLRKGQKNALENDSHWGIESQQRVASIELNYLLCLQCKGQWKYRELWKTCLVVNSSSYENCHFLSLLPSCLELCGPKAKSVTAEHFFRASDCTTSFLEDQVAKSKTLNSRKPNVWPTRFCRAPTSCIHHD